MPRPRPAYPSPGGMGREITRGIRRILVPWGANSRYRSRIFMFTDIMFVAKSWEMAEWHHLVLPPDPCGLGGETIVPPNLGLGGAWH